MTDFSPTPEQSAIVDVIKSSSNNLLISALAGAAKTSTLVLIAKALGTTPILCLAFNKKIADEMRERLPSTCESMTLNSIGHRAWAKFINKRLTVDTRKIHRILTEEIIPALEQKEQKEIFENLSDFIRTIEAGKTAGYIPTDHYPTAERLHNDESFFESLDDEPSVFMREIIQAATLISLKEAYRGIIDFNDQILLPTVFPAQFVQYPVVMVDEAQDLSALNHATLHKIARKRLIAVGDECQSIYGFRGAHQESMAKLSNEFNMTKMTLSISFRCPISIVEASRWRAPHMQYPSWAIPGSVNSLVPWEVEDLPDPATILCRNNAPLFSTAIKLLKNGRYPELVGNDVGKMLIKIMKKLGPSSMKQRDVMEAIAEWTVEKLKKYRGNPSRIHDQADCLRIFAEQGTDLGDAIAYAERLLATSGPVKLMTIHKSKGLEFDDVFILDQDLIGEDQQDQNLLYVAQTRSKSTLTYIQSKDFRVAEND